MVVGEFTASAIAMEEDKREEDEQAKKDATVDYAKLEADIAANKTLAAQVRGRAAQPQIRSFLLCRQQQWVGSER